jgi:hypothetical protein
MPYGLKKTKGGYQVETKTTGATHSKKPLSKSKAKAQMRALYSQTKNENGGRG